MDIADYEVTSADSYRFGAIISGQTGNLKHASLFFSTVINYGWSLRTKIFKQQVLEFSKKPSSDYLLSSHHWRICSH
jgi:hypothetical protein